MGLSKVCQSGLLRLLFSFAILAQILDKRLEDFLVTETVFREESHVFLWDNNTSHHVFFTLFQDFLDHDLCHASSFGKACYLE